ncbi:MAG: hypothetical protein AAFV97_02185 [Bacteroidota bacterium]
MLTTAEQIRRSGIKEGVEQGVELGMERGIEQGMQQGIEQGMQQGIERGRKEGIELRDTEIITHMLRANVPEAQISFLTGLENSKISEIVARIER